MANKTVDYAALGRDILEKVGGEENVAQVVHCATRLRFNLKDPSKADKDAISSLPGVVTVVESAGQFQVVVGNNVPKAYAGLPARLRDAEGGPVESTQKVGIGAKLIDVLSSLFTPILGAMCAVGVLKGLLLMAVALHWLSATAPTYQILWAAADGLFMFLPIYLAVTAARKFGMNPMTAITIAAAMLYTNLATITMTTDGKPVKTTLLAWAKTGHVDFLGIPVSMQSYTSTVIPIILATWLASYVERFGNKFIHESVRNFLTPLLVIVVMVPFSLIALGPLGVWVGNIIAAGLFAVYNAAPWLAGFLIGGLWQVLVIFGAHRGLVPAFINNLAVNGYDPLKATVFAGVLAQAGSALAVMLRSKSAKTRALAGSAAVSGIFGITEPAVYGINLPRKRPFLIAIGAGALGGALAGATHTMVYGTGAPSVLTLTIGFGDPKGLGSTFHWLVISTILGFVLAFLGTFFFGFSKDDRAKDLAAAAAEKADDDAALAAADGTATTPAAATLAGTAAEGSTIAGSTVAAETPAVAKRAAAGVVPVSDDTEISAPVTGEVVALSQLSDPVFASGSMGKGVAIRPTDGTVVSPVTGTVMVSMGHAYGIRTDEGVEVLVHVGIDTVNLKGAPFTGSVAKGTKVNAGDVLAVADLAAIRQAGLDTTTVVVVTNSAKFDDVATIAEGTVTAGAPLLLVIR